MPLDGAPLAELNWFYPTNSVPGEGNEKKFTYYVKNVLTLSEETLIILFVQAIGFLVTGSHSKSIGSNPRLAGFRARSK